MPSDELTKEKQAAYYLAERLLEVVEQTSFMALRQVYNVPTIVGDAELLKLQAQIRDVRKLTGELRDRARTERLKLQSPDA